MSRILCAWSPLWAIANWRRRHPEPAAPPKGDPDAPFALIETVAAVRRLHAVNAAGKAQGLSVGQKATDAKALVPDLVTAEAEPEADARALSELVDWCVRFSPAVAADGTDGLFLDITGVSHLWGGEAELMADLRTRLKANGLPFRLAIADTPGAAWAISHFGKDGTIAPPGGQAALLAPLPPAALRLDPDAVAQLQRLGFRRVAQLMEIPRAPLGRRFGAHTLMRLDQALGRWGEALVFRRPPTPWVARLAFFEPISAPEDMARVTADVCARLCTKLETHGQGARRFEVGFCRLDGKVLPIEVGLAVPGRDAARLAKLFAPKVETVDPGFGVDAVLAWAYEVEPVSGRQGNALGSLAPAPEDGLIPLVDRLANRLGHDRVWRAAPVESHVPEQAVRRAPVLEKAKRDATPWDPEAPRPLRLFRRPEPLEQVFAVTPDEPPKQFRWRGRMHQVRRAEGPERIGEEWWSRDIGDVSIAHVRDYYRVEDQDGGRFWLFRAGLYGDPEAPPKWWLHGLFG
ncbi:DNA polymerase Y family protein [Phenylobacterium sp. J426]|uniref:DNA polymerase Y family protein n=1 Tax=Phenylobacterium sp. J426 TaxID=2898439 RepID=UPI002150D1DA|nr:DNA polymerase Y family protein [Phenylobacterium sp. J426]MCR5874194.1 DNA polymerase Y family protein [Phenylobacterium sp. J426]